MVDLSNENIIHVKNKDVEYLQFRKLLEYKELVHCYTLKDIDVAGNDDMDDKKENVLKNYKKIAECLGVDYNSIIRPYQTHTDVVKSVDNKYDTIQIFPKEFWNVDGLVTNKTNITFSLSYADCIPLFFYDPVKKVIGNVHSGWKGTLQKIGQKAVYKMKDAYNCNPKDIICCIGPSIRKCDFEVEEDVKQQFYNEFNYTNRIDYIIIKKDSSNKYYIDTVLINEIILEEAGLKPENIIDSKICTVCNSDYMHSYRVDKNNAGRNTAIISLR